MKAPTYILKNVYQESLIDSQYQKHVDKMQTIASKTMSVQKKEQSQLEKMEQKRKQKERNRLFNQKQEIFMRQYSDKSLYLKLLETGSRQFVIPQKRQKSMIKKASIEKQYEIGLENVRLGKRILELPAVIQKDQHDKAFQKHEINLQNASRLRIKTKQSNTNAILKDESPTFMEISLTFKLVVFNKELFNKENIKLEYLFSVEILLAGYQLFKTLPITFEQLQSLFMKIPFTQEQFKIHQSEAIILKVWKVKHNTEIYMGQTFIAYKDLITEKDLMKRVNDKEVWNGFIQLDYQ
ncbi:hypothetical protein pb186bvf_009796 [Paramecium bursaria]